MMAGHKWYQVHCTIKRRDMPYTRWTAPRRMVQVRGDLHDRVKEMLGENYDTLFEESQLDSRGAPGTHTGGATVRLGSWLVKLANMITNGEVPPSVAALTLLFFQAPTLGIEASETRVPEATKGVA